MGEGGLATIAKAAAARPALVIPPRNASESFMRGGLDNSTPSPLTIVSSLFAEHESFTECKPFSSFLGSPTFLPMGGSPPIFFNNIDNKGSLLDMHASFKQDNKGNVIDIQASNKQDRCNGIGNIEEIHTSNDSARYRSMMPSRLPIPSATTYFTIPPGLSPTTLLDSPLLFNAGPADPSPTTGSLSNAQKLHDSSLPAGADSREEKEVSLKQQDGFIFKPHAFTATRQELSINGTGCFGVSYQPTLQHRADGPQPVSTPLVDAPISAFESTSGQTSGFLYSKLDSRDSAAPFTRSLETVSTSQVSELAPQYISERTAADGYNWKKYGQKQLKGTEFPRSYYKCTHPNCPVKKQVECSLEGEITEIMYKGEHNHAKPQGTRRGARNNASSWERSERGANFLALDNAGEVSSAINRVDSDRFSTDLSGSSLALSHGCPAATPEPSFGSPSTEEGEDGEASKAEDDCEDEQDSKRRRTENFKEALSSTPIRTIREPRVVVQTPSEVDILDDGYRWRKYGQKVVKGNRFPRSYYKCTNIGCIVRKHVERSSTDPTSVITAYEGKHNHNVPAARGSSREAAGATAGPPQLPTYMNIGLSSSEMGAAPSMLYERQELGSFGENTFNGGTQFSAGMASTSFPDFDRNGTLAVHAVGLNFGGTSSFGAGNSPASAGLGLSLLQPVYPSSSASCVTEGHALRSRGMAENK